jgi:hypothetical protein
MLPYRPTRTRLESNNPSLHKTQWPSMSAQLTDLDLVALMVDGVHFADHLCVVALGIGIDGTKVPLGVVEGSTENATVVTDLLVGLRERGLDVTKPTLVVIDGAKALASAVKAVFDHPVIQRCQLHKLSVYRPSGLVLRSGREGPPLASSGGGYWFKEDLWTLSL